MREKISTNCLKIDFQASFFFFYFLRIVGTQFATPTNAAMVLEAGTTTDSVPAGYGSTESALWK